MQGWIALILVIIGFVVVISMFIKIVKEYERAVIFRLGKVLEGAKGPGLFILVPFVDKMVKVDMRTITLDVPSQEAITQDNVTVRVNAVTYFRVLDPVASVVQIEDYRRATSQIAQTSLRNVIGQSTLDQLLQNREAINDQLQNIIDEATEPWGIKVAIVEIKDVELNTQMIRAMAREAEAERERRAKVIHATGELEASKELAEAARAINTADLGIAGKTAHTCRDTFQYGVADTLVTQGMVDVRINAQPCRLDRPAFHIEDHQRT